MYSAIKLTSEFFALKHFAPGMECIIDLETSVNVHMCTASGFDFDFSIGYIWPGMVGFDVWQDGCCCCSTSPGTVITMPDGTEIKNYNNKQFVRDVVAWIKTNCVKLELPQEVEFMDI